MPCNCMQCTNSTSKMQTLKNLGYCRPLCIITFNRRQCIFLANSTLDKTANNTILQEHK